MRRPRVAVVGATGAVGPIVLDMLHERGFPAAEVAAFASARSAGTRVPFAGSELEVRELTPDALEGFDLALFSAGGGDLAGVRAGGGRARVRRRRQVERLPHGPAGAARRPRGERGRRRLAPGHRLEPELLHDPARVRPRAASRGGGPRARHDRDLPGGVRHRSQGSRRAAIAIAGCARWRRRRADGVPASDRVQRDSAMRELRGGQHVGGDEARARAAEDPRRRHDRRSTRPVCACRSGAAIPRPSGSRRARRSRPARRARSSRRPPGVQRRRRSRRGRVPARLRCRRHRRRPRRAHPRDPSRRNGLASGSSADNLRKGAATNGIQIAELLVERDLVRVPGRAAA